MIGERKILNRLNWCLASFFTLWVLGWLSIGAYYCFPNAEDLSLTAAPRDLGLLKSIVSVMVSYDGRYFTNLLHGINPLVYNCIWGYKLMPILGVVVFEASFLFFLFTLFETKRMWVLVFLSLFFVAVHFVTAPSLPHDLYWMVSSFVYLDPWSFIFMWLAAYIRYTYAVHTRGALGWFFVSVIFLICSIGMNEMFLIVNLSLLLALSCTAYRRGRPTLIRTIPIVFIGVACILFFVSSPGIPLRAAANRNPQENLISYKGIIQSISDYPTSIINLSKNGILLFSALLVLIHFDQLKFRYNDMEALATNKRISSAIFAFLIVAYLMTLAYYIPMQVDTGYPARIFNSTVVLPEFVFFILLPLLLFKNSLIVKIVLNKGLQQILTFSLLSILIALLFLTKNNICEMRREYSQGIFQRYDQTMKLRYATINIAKQSQKCWQVATVDSLLNPPSTIYYGPEIAQNRKNNHWNIAYEVYFRIDEVRITGDTTFKQIF